jgi:hypothetical protein
MFSITKIGVERILVEYGYYWMIGTWVTYPHKCRPKKKEDQVLEVNRSGVFMCRDYNRNVSYGQIKTDCNLAFEYVKEPFKNITTDEVRDLLVRKVFDWFIRTVDETVKAERRPRIHYRFHPGPIVREGALLVVCNRMVYYTRTTRVRRKVTCEQCKKKMGNKKRR